MLPDQFLHCILHVSNHFIDSGDLVIDKLVQDSYASLCDHDQAADGQVVTATVRLLEEELFSRSTLQYCQSLSAR